MIIELLDGTRFDTADYSLRRLYHYIPSASIEHNSVSLDGRSDIILNSKINNRVISVNFVYLSQDIFDFYLIREKVNALFLREEPYYIIFKNEPHKRWLVKCNTGYDLQPNMRIEEFTVEFITMNAYAESVATTQDLKEWDIDKWAWNGSITWDDDLQYTFNTNNFVVNNLGNVIIDPRISYLEIVIRANADSYFNLVNDTTAQRFSYNGPLTSNDELVLSGIRFLKNRQSVLRDTNKLLMLLLPGINYLRVEGGDIESISFNFRFLYK